VNIAIVDMIDQSFRKASNNTIIESECFENFTKSNVNLINSFLIEERERFPSLERKLLDSLRVSFYFQYKLT
jgi:hypothetical protein